MCHQIITSMGNGCNAAPTVITAPIIFSRTSLSATYVKQLPFPDKMSPRSASGLWVRTETQFHLHFRLSHHPASHFFLFVFVMLSLLSITLLSSSNTIEFVHCNPAPTLLRLPVRIRTCTISFRICRFQAVDDLSCTSQNVSRPPHVLSLPYILPTVHIIPK